MAEKIEATITVREIKKRDADFVKFGDASGKIFNCNVQKYMANASDGEPIFNPGRRLDIFYHEYEGETPQGKPYVSKYIDECRPATKSNTWPDKEPYQGGGGNGSHGPSSRTGEFRTPEQIMRGQAADVVSHLVEPVPIEKLDGAVISALLDAAEIVDTYISGTLACRPVDNGGLADYVAQAAETFDGKPEPDDGVPF